MSRIIITFILTLLLAGCAATGPMFSNAPHLNKGESGVYVYRTKHLLLGKGLAASVYVDGKKLGKLRDNGFLYKKLTPGRHTVGVASSGTLFKTVILRKQIAIKPGIVKYIKLEWKTNGSMETYSGNVMLPGYDWSLRVVLAGTARNELQTLRYS